MRTGVNLEDSLKKYPRLFPAVVTQLAEVGQETGAMDEILEKMAEFFENEVDSVVKNLSTIIEPILMIIIAIGVGIVAAAVLLPVYTIIDKLE